MREIILEMQMTQKTFSVHEKYIGRDFGVTINLVNLVLKI